MTRVLFGRRQLAALFTALLITVGLIGLQLQRGEAHAGLDYSNPTADETLTTAPEFVEIFFTQEVSSDQLIVAVLGPDSTRIDNEDSHVDLCEASRKRVVVTLPGSLPDGEYIVQWETLSAEDGETDSGFFEFTLQSGAASPAASPEVSPVASPFASPSAVTCP